MTNIRESFHLPQEVTGEEITLNDGEQVTARMVANMRTGLNRIKGVRDAKKSPRDAYDIELDGIGGEMAFAKMRNLCPDLNVLPRKGGHDFTTHKGNTVDVKTTPLDKNDLLVMANKADVFLESNLVDLGHGMTYKVPQERLTR